MEKREVDDSFALEIIRCMENTKKMMDMANDVYALCSVSERNKIDRGLNRIDAGFGRVIDKIFKNTYSEYFSFEQTQRVNALIRDNFPEVYTFREKTTTNSFNRTLNIIRKNINKILPFFIIPYLYSNFSNKDITLQILGTTKDEYINGKRCKIDEIENLNESEKEEYFDEQVNFLLEANSSMMNGYGRDGVISAIGVQISAIESLYDIFQKKIQLAIPTTPCNPEDLLILENLTQIDGYSFERFLHLLFLKMGYSSIQTLNGRDQGCDIILIGNERKFVIQAKNYKKSVGNSAIQEIGTAINLYDAQKGIVIVTSDFTKQAKELAEANHIELINGKELSKIMLFFPITHKELFPKSENLE